jgi:D-alanine-D-alanine ligase
MPHTKRTVWIVGDARARSNTPAYVYDFSADYPSRDEIDFIAACLADDFDVKALSAKEFHDAYIPAPDIVLPLWVGGKSRNRTALVPALCELRNIKYVGGDAFVHSACQDKNFSKLISQHFNIQCPRGFVLPSTGEMPKSFNLDYPVVVKPLYGGSSVGITEFNLCENREQAAAAIDQILSKGLGPIIIEEFIRGEEYYLSLYIKNNKIIDYQAVKWITEDGNTFLSDRIFHFNLKVNWDVDLQMKECGADMPSSLIENIERLCEYFTPIDILRCDFRGPLDNLKLIELTPDMNLAPDAEFVGGFHAKGSSFSEIYTNIINYALEKY